MLFSGGNSTKHANGKAPVRILTKVLRTRIRKKLSSQVSRLGSASVIALGLGRLFLHTMVTFLAAMTIFRGLPRFGISRTFKNSI